MKKSVSQLRTCLGIGRTLVGPLTHTALARTHVRLPAHSLNGGSYPNPPSHRKTLQAGGGIIL